MGRIDWQAGKLADAQQMLEDSLHLAQTHAVKDTALALARLGLVRALRGDVDAGLDLARQGHDQIAGSAREKSPDAVDVHDFFGRTLELARRLPEAQAEYRAAIAAQSALLPPDGMHFFSADARLALGRLLGQNAQTRDEARRLTEQALLLSEQALGADHPQTLATRQQLATILAAH
jgi:tetratricopeptide (TPR) repeat protein